MIIGMIWAWCSRGRRAASKLATAGDWATARQSGVTLQTPATASADTGVLFVKICLI